MRYRATGMVVVILWLAGCFSASEDNPSIEYVPVVYVAERDIGLVYDRSLTTAEHLDRLEHVLAYHGHAFERVAPERLLIVENLSEDLDYMWNMTSKAEDPHWLSTHRIDQITKKAAR